MWITGTLAAKHLSCKDLTQARATNAGMVQEEVPVEGGWGRRPRGLFVVFRSAKGDLTLTPAHVTSETHNLNHADASVGTRSNTFAAFDLSRIQQVLCFRTGVVPGMAITTVSPETSYGETSGTEWRKMAYFWEVFRAISRSPRRQPGTGPSVEGWCRGCQGANHSDTKLCVG
jgi:hypothetical protein